MNIDRFFLKRRQFLRWLVLVALMPLPADERLPKPFRTSFFQPWEAHARQPFEKWLTLIKQMQQLGCDQIILQWVGVSKPNERWELSDSTLNALLDQCLNANMRMQIGLPYDEQWWGMLRISNNFDQLDAYLTTVARQSKEYLARATWPDHPAFNGWYIPYEIEQHSWFEPVRRKLLVSWLRDISGACLATHPVLPGISTYLSLLSDQDQLPVVWSDILAEAALRPMIQDGVGVSGLSNYQGLAPLRRLFLDRNIKFDLIVELFEQTSSQSGSEPFSASSAPYARVRRQLQIAQTYGASDVVAFAVEPWMLGQSQSARRLRSAWRAIY